MTQEDKQLLLNDLSARLSYKVKARIINKWNIAKIIALNSEIGMAEVRPDMYIRDIHIEAIRPYLFPMDSMTKEQKEELKTKILDGFKIYGNGNIYYPVKNVLSGAIGIKINTMNKYIDWLNKNHFDYRGLIDKGLAIDATNLEIY